MAATKEDLKRWFQEGVEKSATHMIVVCDTFDYDDYPVFVKRGENIEDKIAHYNDKNMQTIMEIYNLHSMTWEQQEHGRAFNKQPAP
jgi:hypothetical protein